MFPKFKTTLLLKMVLVCSFILILYCCTHVTTIPDSLEHASNVQDDFLIGKQYLNTTKENKYKECVTEKQKPCHFEWILQPKPCDKSTAVLLLIKSSVVRNSLRNTVRKSWGQNIEHSIIGR